MNNNNEKNSLFPRENDFTGEFSVPENYFEKLENNIQEKVNRIPILYTIKNENPYTVPDGYFAELENSIREKVFVTKERFASAPFYLRPRFVPEMTMLVIVVACTVTFIVLNRHDHSISEKDISFSDIYNSSYVSELDEAALAELIEESAHTNSGTSQFENYIIEENTDIHTLTEEL